MFSAHSVVWVNSVGIASTLIIFAFRPASKVFALVFLVRECDLGG